MFDAFIIKQLFSVLDLMLKSPGGDFLNPDIQHTAYQLTQNLWKWDTSVVLNNFQVMAIGSQGYNVL